MPNPNFEAFSNCPTDIHQIEFAIPWMNPTGATPDFFHTCSNSIAVDVPVNFWGDGYQLPLTGNGYAGAHFRGPNEYREYIQIQLMEPMEEGICYNVGFFFNKNNQWCGISQAGIYISASPPSIINDDPLPVNPQIEANGGYYSDTVTWVEISGFYPALGGEQYITIGNFRSDMESPYDPACEEPPGYSYYYIDSVFVLAVGPADELQLDLGPDVESCVEYEIDGESGDVNYYWSTGSTTSTTIVDSTDTYALTITQGCAIGIDSVEVTLIVSTPVDIDPGTVTLCEGESYTVTLDPDAGEYLWDDGSTDNTYVITAPGLYSVTLDDGCEISSDDILADLILLPLPVDIGNDAILCEGDEIDIALGPIMNTIEWQDGSNVMTYTIVAPGIYAVTISNSCGEVSDQIEVTGLQQPEIELGPDTLAWCVGAVIAYDFDPDQGDYVWSDDSTDPTFFIFTPGTYSVTVSNECGSTIDEVTVYAVAEPVTGLGDTIGICASALPFTLSVEEFSTLDDFIWSTGEMTSQIIVSNPGTYAVTVSNNCFSVSDSVFLNIIPAPILNLPDTEVICIGDTLFLNAGTSSAAYSWQDGSNLQTYAVTGPGLYSVTVTNTCGTAGDSVVINEFIVADPPDLGPDLSLCPGQQVTLFANAATATFIWNDLSTADTLLVSTPGEYSVTIQDQCAIAADTILVTSNNSPPVVDLPASLLLCDGQSVLVDANVMGVDYLWNDGTMDQTLTVTVPGAYSVTVSNTCGSDVDTVLVADGGALPAIDLGNDIQLCPGQSQILSPDLTSADSWTWQDGSTEPTFLVDDAGQVTIEVRNECGSVFDTLDALLLPGVPLFDLGNDTALCATDILLLEINIGDVIITWFDGSHNDQITIIGSGTYTAEIANACGVSTDTLIINSLGDSPQFSLGPDQFLCPGELITFDPGIFDVEYLWHDSTNATSFSTTQPGEVILTISNECGISTDTVLIVESMQGPQLDLGPDMTGCIGDTVTIQSGIGGVDYIWQDGSTNSFFEVTNDAELTLHITNACGEDRDTLNIAFITPPDPDLGPDTVLCDDDKLTLTSAIDPNMIVTWQDGSHGSEYIVTSDGIYSLQQSNSCGDKTDSIVVTYQASPDPFSLGPDVILCAGESIILYAPATTDQLIWQDGSNTFTITANTAQVYSLTISNTCGSAYDELIVAIDSEEPVLEFDSVAICPGDVLTLNATQPFVAEYLWSTGASTSSINVMLPGAYSVTVITHCFEMPNVIHIFPADDCKPVTQFFIPNIFSPNGDHINDEFTIQFNDDAEVVSVTGHIFDRWGNLIYQSEQHPFTWDGTFNDNLMNPGVYVYQFILVYSDGVNEVTEKVTGNVAIIR